MVANVPTDHHIIEFCLRSRVTRGKPVCRRVFNYNQANFQGLCAALFETSLDISTTSDINSCWTNWNMYYTTISLAKLLKIAILLLGLMLKYDISFAKKYSALRSFRSNRTPQRKLKLRNLSQCIKYAICAANTRRI